MMDIRIDGRWEMVEVDHTISGRGKCVTWTARDAQTGQEAIALELKPHLARDPEARGAVLKGLQALSRLDHPGLQRVLAIRDDPERGCLAYVVDRLPGRSLSRLLRIGTVFREREVVHVGLALLDALAHAHSRGVVFGNVKSSNVIVLDQGKGAVLIGLPKPPFQFRSFPQVGAYLGNPHECPPEMIRDGVFGPAADLYGVGMVLYGMCTGNREVHFQEHLADLFAEITDRALPLLGSLLPGISPRLGAVIDRAVSKDPAARHESAEAMRAELARVPLGDMPLLTPTRMRDLVVSRMPQPIAQPYDGIDHVRDPVARLGLIVDVSQACLQLLGSVVVAERLEAGEPDSIPDEWARAGFTRPSLGHWAAIVRGASPETCPTVPELGTLCRDERGRPTPFLKAMEALVALRNDVRHGVTPPPAVARRLLEESAADFDGVLSGALFLRQYEMFVTTRMSHRRNEFEYDLLCFPGVVPTGEVRSLHRHSPLDSDQVYLADASFSRVLSLHPLVIRRVCPVCQDEEIFLYESMGDSRVHYLSFSKGHGLSEESLMADFVEKGLVPSRI